MASVALAAGSTVVAAVAVELEVVELHLNRLSCLDRADGAAVDYCYQIPSDVIIKKYYTI